MSGVSHTPGPWKFGHMGDAERYWIGPNYDQPIVAFADREMPEANARLIAAAPELLEELERLRKATLDDRQDISAARSDAARVIAKARGDA